MTRLCCISIFINIFQTIFLFYVSHCTHCPVFHLSKNSNSFFQQCIFRFYNMDT